MICHIRNTATSLVIAPLPPLKDHENNKKLYSCDENESLVESKKETHARVFIQCLPQNMCIDGNFDFE